MSTSLEAEGVGETSANEHLSFLHGMRTLSMWWILLAQTYYYMLGFTSSLLDLLNVDITKFGFQTVLSTGYAIDTFLFISGFLLTFKLLKRLKTHGMSVWQWIYLYYHRFIRLTPSYMFVLFFYSTLILRVLSSSPSGSFWLVRRENLESAMSHCDQYWWSNLLYINNFYPVYTTSSCMPWTWFMALSMQLFLISPLIIYICHKFQKLGTFILFLLVSGCCVGIGVITSEYKLPVWNYERTLSGNETAADNDPSVDYYEYKPYTRGVAYFMGMMVAVLVSSIEKPSMAVKLNKAFVFLLTLLVVFLQGVVTFAMYKYAEDRVLNALTLPEIAAYHSLAILTWSLSLAWITYICITGNGGWITSFLGWRGWKLFSRLTYGVFLVHPIILINYYGNLEYPVYLSLWTLIYIYLGHICVCYAAALLVAVLVEYPIRSLEKWLIRVFQQRR